MSLIATINFAILIAAILLVQCVHSDPRIMCMETTFGPDGNLVLIDPSTPKILKREYTNLDSHASAFNTKSQTFMMVTNNQIKQLDPYTFSKVGSAPLYRDEPWPANLFYDTVLDRAFGIAFANKSVNAWDLSSGEATLVAELGNGRNWPDSSAYDDKNGLLYIPTYIRDSDSLFYNVVNVRNGTTAGKIPLEDFVDQAWYVPELDEIAGVGSNNTIYMTSGLRTGKVTYKLIASLPTAGITVRFSSSLDSDRSIFYILYYSNSSNTYFGIDLKTGRTVTKIEGCESLAHCQYFDGKQ